MIILPEKQQKSKVYFTKITSTESNITKRFWKDADGTLQKESGGQLWEGTVEVCRETFEDFIRQIMEPKEVPWVVVYGRPIGEGTRWELITEKQANEQGRIRKGQIMRKRDYFSFPETPGFLVLDYDPPKFLPDERDKKLLSKEDLRDILWKAMPEWKEKNIQMAILDSTSSYIYTTDGEQLKGEGGKRVIIPVADTSKVPSITEELVRRLWLNGYGRHKISKAGTLIETTIFDDCYGNQPERIDFSPAGADCQRDIYQNRPEPLITGTTILFPSDTRITKGKKSDEQIKSLISKDREHRNLAALPIRETWKSGKVEEMVRKNPKLSPEDARRQIDQLYNGGRLGEDYLLQVEGENDLIPVSEIISNPELWHEKKCYPPLDEEDEDYQRFCSIIYSDQNKPQVFSHAHGGIKFSLPRKRGVNNGKKEWVFPFGRDNDDGANALTEELTKTNELFSRVGEKAVFIITKNGITPLSSIQLEREITKRYHIVEHPGEDAKQLSVRDRDRIWSWGQISFPECLGISKVPILHKDGSWMSERGYDKESRYFVDGSWKINENPTEAEIKEALDLILNKVWGEFSFSYPKEDRGVLLSLILSGFYIPLTPKRPGYLITAAERGSGKTLLATTINLLIDNTENTKDLKTRSDNDELIRMVEADRRKGIRVHIFDNLKDGRSLWENTLSMVLTSSTISHKKLHSNDSISTQNDILAIFTGNNIIAAQDNARRLFCLYIEKQNKKFVISPDNFIRKNRDKVIEAVVTLINGYIKAGCPVIADDEIGSYDAWDRLVRQNILWLGKKFDKFNIGDPRDNMTRGEEENPDDQHRRALFYEIEKVYGYEKFSASDLVKKIKEVEGDDLREALEALFPNQPKSMESSHAVSQKLGAIKKKTFSYSGGYQLTLQKLEIKTGGKSWFQMERKHQEPTGTLPISDEKEISNEEEIVRTEAEVLETEVPKAEAQAPKQRWRRKTEWERN